MKGVDLEIPAGEVVALLGPNGAGKTTIIDMVLGLSMPTSGSVTVRGMTAREAVDAGLVAAVTQTGGLLNDIAVGDHVRIVADIFGYGKQRADEVMAQVGIAGIAHRKTQMCSGGEKQRLKFAMALIPNPELIILDEPTTGMDVAARKAFWGDIHDQALSGRTVLFATHYLEEADEYADRVVVIAEGVVVADGTTAEIRNLAAGRTVQADFPSGEAAATAAAQVRDGSIVCELQGPRLIVHTQDSDRVVAALSTAGGRNLTVTSESLEAAFLKLTERSNA
ncbi:ABC transporter ATP-binding protein [Propionicicella superfundia]|uniref:ABC transporter ATP-binding protein n=1 Tax=Propionicicella superfundia TaxID=348582 RepID=UPI0004271CD1|nr:ABC transporter ATP-binding protein [Propionicicella superfundia]